MAAQETSQTLRALGLEFEKQEDCDVVFNVNGRTIGAHRLMLKIKSQVLYEMAVGWNHNREPIAIQSMDFSSFKSLLRFIYTDAIQLSNENVFLFLSAATRYRMAYLEEVCIAHLSRTMRSENLCIYMNEGVNFKSTALQEKCRELFSKHTDKVLDQESFLELSQPALSSFLDAESTNVLEIELFGNIKDWIAQRCLDRRLPTNGANMRYVLGDALYKIRFPTMTVQDFANSVTTIKGLLTDTEKAQVFQMITVFDTSDINCPFPNQFRCKRNRYYTPFNDMTQLHKSPVLFNNERNTFMDIKSMVDYIRDLSDGEEIKVTSLRLVLQCCADLANSSGTLKYSDANDRTIRRELSDELDAWQDITRTKIICNIMTKYMEIRSTLNRLCAWC